ncbi:SDR family oxidoreductase [Thermococcus sp. AM4]|uniref:SDR family NAD(P)-dependent oxidoreductase n=1 Tax=Thermococcus sp. (strain AM4) TaxID=246969 RepID=UPI0001870DB6|nr:SDR family NAD(P)-dependent oxidoreductase [Thermococcus sp. AM4]EEB74088.1 Short-chain alcohol dehydrogenase [Thermococcus sp. AM4]
MIALVTGATGGIGRLLVKALLDEGYRVVGVGRRREKLEELKALGNFDYIVEDLSEPGSTERIAKALRELGIGELDLLVNNAGYALRKPILQHSDEELERLFRVNALVPVELTRELLPLLRPGSTVVFVISGVAFVNVPELPSYCAAKGALHYLAVNLERELKGRGIRVMRVYPKQVKTEFFTRNNVPYPKGSIEPEDVVRAIMNGLKKGKREVFVPGYLKLVKYLPNWPVFTYRFRY